MTTALITGANKGLGYETADQLATRGWTVYLAARDAERGTLAAEELSATGADVRFVLLDVTSDTSVTAAAATVAAQTDRLDVLVNNAGIGGGWITPADATGDEMRHVYDTNVFGPVRVTHAFLPLLRASDNPRVVMVSSGMGSHGVTGDPTRVEHTLHSVIYPSSKAALNMVTAQYAAALPEFRVNAADPGYTATDLNNHSGSQTIAEGAEIIVRLATLAPDGPTGGFFDRRGKLPW